MLLVVLGCTSQTSTPSSTASIVPTPSPTITLTPTPAATQTSTPTSTSPSDTTPPSEVTGLVANNAYDGKINLWWDKSAATDFDHYNIYLDKADIADVTGMKATQQIKDIATCRYQATGLEDGTMYYFTITAVDKIGNEDVNIVSASATPVPMPSGTVDPYISVNVYQSELVWAGTTLLVDSHNPDSSRIIEVNMSGDIVWEYVVPQQGTTEAELLPNNNILYTVGGYGVYEIDRSGKVVWSYLTVKVSHDADRLPNGNTIFVFGAEDQKSDAQVTEVNLKGEIVWTWYAKDHFDKAPYNDIYEGGWTHTNAVTRLTNDNTLISLRNFDFVVEVDPTGEVVRTIGEGVFFNQHDPEVLPNGNILMANHSEPNRAIEFDPKTSKIVWQSAGFKPEASPVRDANRLPNGNTLITGTTEIVEVTPEGEIVWSLKLQGVSFSGKEINVLGFYKADRISAQE